MKIIAIVLSLVRIGWPIAKAVAVSLQDGVITRQEARNIAEEVLDLLVGDDDKIVLWGRGDVKQE